eukprot:TRINITY_DN227_c1_g1_i2.p1 TRINITY_DN227_c1_g1~~TRINITY_DN227_c1_g1_i2.p1  ORF type:complete len:222 (-),score=30.99 TRINITY_DN227_c1_g1_i2:778-1443(-)
MLAARGRFHPARVRYKSLHHRNSNSLHLAATAEFCSSLQTLTSRRYVSNEAAPAHSPRAEDPNYWMGYATSSSRGGMGPPPPPQLLASRVSCMRGGHVIFCEMNLSVHAGGGVLLTGPNGSGKSSLLRMLAGFIKPSAGVLLWEGHSLTDRNVYQLYKVNVHLMSAKEAIKENMTVDENVRFWAHLEGCTSRVDSALRQVGLGALQQRPAAVLSLGQGLEI